MRPIKILVIENNKNYRRIITSALKAIEFVKVIGSSASCLGALKLIASSSPDIVFLDYEMPRTDIKNTINRVKSINANTEIVLVSETRRTSSASSIRALKLGALYFIKKPTDNTSAENIQYFAKYLRPLIKLFVVNQRVEVIKKVSNEIDPHETKILPPARTKCRIVSDFGILAIGCSLGGPDALNKIIPGLPADFPIPIVITQHMPEGFTSILASKLDFQSKLIVMEGRNGISLQPGYAYIAPGGKHMQIKEVNSGSSKQKVIVLDDGPLIHNCRPAVDVMFNSLAKNLNCNILTVILTGMGRDGLVGVEALKKHGNCFCMTQDQASSVVYGMPGEIAMAGLSDLSLPLGSIAGRIKHMVCESAQTIESI
ncbi:MAG: chemotaxis-specific protein-glutamate methyltransferase CheB [candidate division Zixibacteria bacterium]|nr:chemotaxis-specific protein-glutamate methyltransferase CheB [candidate division Zixibacteria bacterium]